MKNVKFIVKVNRGGTRVPEYVERVDPTPIHMTTNRKAGTADGEIHGPGRRQIPPNFPVHPGARVRTGYGLVFVLRRGQPGLRQLTGEISLLHSLTVRRHPNQLRQRLPMPRMRSVPLANPARIPSGHAYA
jgi:hypothetical protein